MSFWHDLGFHDWHYVEDKHIVQPKCGVFDPRTNKDRTITKHLYVCCVCGKEKLREPPSYDIP